MATRLAQLAERRVYPGEPLCAVEEFLPGDGVYVDDGVIRAARLGVVEVDMAARRISVRPLAGKPRLPARGSAVYGIVTGIPREDLALVKIFADERMRYYNGFFSGVIHISQVSPGPGAGGQQGQRPSIYDYVRIGDFVRVTVLSDTPPYALSMRKAVDGVILAYCSICGAPLYKEPGSSQLVCQNCGHRETRRVSAQYMLVLRGRRGGQR